MSEYRETFLGKTEKDVFAFFLQTQKSRLGKMTEQEKTKMLFSFLLTKNDTPIEQEIHRIASELSLEKKLSLDMAIVLLHHAKKRNPRACFLLGECYRCGFAPFKADKEKSLHFHRIAWNRGFEDSKSRLLLLGLCAKKERKAILKAHPFSKDDIFTKKVKAEYLFRKGYVKKAREIWEENIERGDIESLLALGISYRTGKRKERDYQKAFLLFAEASRKGYLIAKCEEGEAYFRGRGVKKDWDKARQCFEGDLTNPHCLKRLGDILSKTDSEEAKKFYRKALERGNEEAKVPLAKILALSSDRKERGEGFLLLRKEAAKDSGLFFLLSILYGKRQDKRNQDSYLCKALAVKDKRAIFFSYHYGKRKREAQKALHELKKEGRADSLLRRLRKEGILKKSIFLR